MFPIAQRQFTSMAQMRAVQPKMKALQERYKDDRTTLQQKTMELYKQEGVNPAPMDAVQEQVFKIMPWLMMFMMAPFAAGLLIYWITSNILTLGQQKYLYSKHPQLRAQAEL